MNHHSNSNCSTRLKWTALWLVVSLPVFGCNSQTSHSPEKSTRRASVSSQGSNEGLVVQAAYTSQIDLEGEATQEADIAEGVAAEVETLDMNEAISTLATEVKESALNAETKASSSEVDDSSSSVSDVESKLQEPMAAERLLPEERPEWIAAKDDFSGDVHTLIVTTPPESDLDHCEQKLPVAALAKLTTYAHEQLGIDVRAIPRINEKWVENRLLTKKDRFYLEREIDGSMTCSGWAKIQIDPFTRNELLELSQQSQWLPRSIKVGSSMLGVLAVFGVIHFTLLALTGSGRPKVTEETVAKI